MTKIFNFAQSELFLSLIGGFALGIAAMTLINPASADSGDTQIPRSIQITEPDQILR